MALISTIIRQFYIPNPFEALGDGLSIEMGDNVIIFTPFLLNWLAEPFVYILTYSVVGLYYRRGSAPALGSVLYLVFYCIHTFMLWLMSMARFNMWLVVAIIVVYFLGDKFIEYKRNPI